MKTLFDFAAAVVLSNSSHAGAKGISLVKTPFDFAAGVMLSNSSHAGANLAKVYDYYLTRCTCLGAT